MPRSVLLLTLLIASACSQGLNDISKPQIPNLVDSPVTGNQFGFRRVNENVIFIENQKYEIADINGPIVVPRMPVCNAIDAIFRSLQVSHSCNANGLFSFYSRSTDGANILATLVQALRATGYIVTLGQAITIQGNPGQDATAVTDTQLPSGASEIPDIQPAGTGFVAFDELSIQSVQTIIQTVAQPSTTVRRFRADESAAEAIRTFARENALHIRAVTNGTDVIVYGPANEVNLAVSAFSAAETTISSEVAGISESGVSALKEAFPNMVIAYDTDSSTLHVRGDAAAIQSSASTLGRLVREPMQVRTEVVFASYRQTRGSASSLGFLQGSDFRLSDGVVTAPLDGDVSLVLELLRREGRVSILSRPLMTAREGVPAEFTSATQVPIRRTTVTEGIVVSDYEFKDVGTIVTSTSRLTPSGLIKSDIVVEMSTLAQEDPPIIDRRRVTTSVTVKSGQSVVLAGLSAKETSGSRLGFPGFSTIGGRSLRSSTSDELVIVIRPVIVTTSGPALRENLFQ